mgnify:CR=1 FL=1
MGFSGAFDYTGPHAVFAEHAALSAEGNDGSRAFDIGVGTGVLSAVLARRGIAVRDMAWQRRTTPPTIWFQVPSSDGQLAWVVLVVPLMEEREGARLVGLFLLATALVMVLSWMPARRMTRQLERLRERIHSGRPLPPEPASLASTPEIVDIESAYEQLLNEVQRQHRERALLLAGVSHDLRSPLSRIRMAAELLPDDAAHTTRRTSIIANVQVADRLIGDFLDFVRSTELPMTDRVDVSECARRVAQDFDVPSDTLQVHAPSGVVLGHANQHLLERAIFNLIDNAFRHGTPPVSLHVSSLADGVAIDVHDIGPGMPLTAWESLLQPFARGDASRSVPGTGLGLAITRHLAQLMGGETGVTSTLGKGSIFWFTVRMQRGHGVMPASAGTSRANAEAILRKRHVGRKLLLAEDNEINREVALELRLREFLSVRIFRVLLIAPLRENFLRRRDDLLALRHARCRADSTSWPISTTWTAGSSTTRTSSRISMIRARSSARRPSGSSTSRGRRPTR